jgi:hypothetical protein
MLHGRPGTESAGVDQALPGEAPPVDVLGHLRAGAPDIGAFEWIDAFPADFDEDGDVDGDDLVQWRGDFGLSAFSDADSDGDSDGADFLVWQQHLGSLSTLAATSVPEPGVHALIAAAPLILACARRERLRWVR